MIVVSWNCNGAFRKKCENILKFNPDILIIQECENPDMVRYPVGFNDLMPNHIWVGDNKNKGLAIFSKYKLVKNMWEDGKNKYFISCNIMNEFNLLGVWCHQANSPTFGYIGQLWKYLQINKSNFIWTNDTLICGDFNSNSIWDAWDRWWNHSDVIREFEELGIRSLYHLYFKENQGSETVSTLFHRKNTQKGFHIDYMLGSKRFQDSLSKFEIGECEKWISISDHMPVVIEVV
ncbi:MAG: endonuclease/exonuclease/phosphatase family protein [Clostridia bacterium]